MTARRGIAGLRPVAALPLLALSILALSILALSILAVPFAARAAGPVDVAVDTDISFALDEPKAEAAWRVFVPEPGLLAVETDFETMDRIDAAVTDDDGRVIGDLGARLATPGAYTVTIRRRAGVDDAFGMSRWDGNGTTSLNLWDPDTDAFEPNDGEATRTRFAPGPDSPRAGGPVSLYPRNDSDPYLIEMDRPDWLTAGFAVTELHDPDLDLWLQADNDDRTRLDKGRSLRLAAGSHRFRLMADRPFVLPAGLTLSFAPDWDTCEPNDSMETACPLEDGIAKQVSFYPDRDQDWFSLDLPRKGVVAIALAGLPQPDYDPAGNLIRGARISVWARGPEGAGIRHVQIQVAHGTIFMDVPVSGRYLLNLQAEWVGGANPVRALELTPRYFDAAATGGAAKAPFSILGIDTSQSLSFTVLAGIGRGKYYAASNARDIASAIRDFMDLPDAPTPRPGPAPSQRRSLVIDRDLQDKDPALLVAVQKARDAWRIDLNADRPEPETADRSGDDPDASAGRPARMPQRPTTTAGRNGWTSPPASRSRRTTGPHRRSGSRRRLLRRRPPRPRPRPRPQANSTGCSPSMRRWRPTRSCRFGAGTTACRTAPSSRAWKPAARRRCRTRWNGRNASPRPWPGAT
ncbi:hypothetical protein ACFOGJ_10895 [Marinibaculum pumilum]|uniref:Uncharacterized protein n=1 Tax=Marinibaculum pumilum TaxID=1766165 RepID=A0ABV7KZJ4_9PROT